MIISAGIYSNLYVLYILEFCRKLEASFSGAGKKNKKHVMVVLLVVNKLCSLKNMFYDIKQVK